MHSHPPSFARSSQLGDFLRITEGLPLQDDVYAWITTNFSCRPRPIVDTAAASERRREKDASMCLTKRGFVRMYKHLWQAAGRNLEVRRRVFVRLLTRLIPMVDGLTSRCG